MLWSFDQKKAEICHIHYPCGFMAPRLRPTINLQYSTINGCHRSLSSWSNIYIIHSVHFHHFWRPKSPPQHGFKGHVLCAAHEKSAVQVLIRRWRGAKWVVAYTNPFSALGNWRENSKKNEAPGYGCMDDFWHVNFWRCVGVPAVDLQTLHTAHLILQVPGHQSGLIVKSQHVFFCCRVQVSRPKEGAALRREAEAAGAREVSQREDGQGARGCGRRRGRGSPWRRGGAHRHGTLHRTGEERPPAPLPPRAHGPAH